MGNDWYPWSKPITTSDTVNLEFGLTDAVYVGGAGVVVAVYQDGTLGTFTVPAGAILPLRVKRINATNTTATLMNALYAQATTP